MKEMKTKSEYHKSQLVRDKSTSSEDYVESDTSIETTVTLSVEEICSASIEREEEEYDEEAPATMPSFDEAVSSLYIVK